MPLALVYLKSRCGAFIQALRCAKVIAEKLYTPPDHDEWRVLLARDGKRDEPNEWPPVPGAYSRVIDCSVGVSVDEPLLPMKDEKCLATKKQPRRPRKSKAAKADPFIVKDETEHDNCAYVPPTALIATPTTPIRCSKRLAERPAVDYQRFYELSPPLRHTPEFEEEELSNENDFEIAGTGCDDVQMDSADPEPQSHQDPNVQVDYTQSTLQPARSATPTSSASPSVYGMPSDVTFPTFHPETPSRQLSSGPQAWDPQAAVSSSDVDVDIPAAPCTNSDFDGDDTMYSTEEEDYFTLRAQGDHDTRVVHRKVARAREEDEPEPDVSRPNKRMKGVASKVVF
ncbi:hypothetical protein BDZ89DRAFT_1115695 [Hymenopellis radicata]|nr:hypothetical protein BDZ89DRAFT_1115695 [Hymenopellis radicata]